MWFFLRLDPAHSSPHSLVYNLAMFSRNDSSSCMLVPAFDARPADPPLPLLEPKGLIQIYHPSVHHGLPILQLSCFPTSPGSNTFGVPVGLVLDACFVVANNRPGELQLNVSPHTRVAGADSDQDALLLPGKYRLVVVREGGMLEGNYHLCSSFAAWTPPLVIPHRWLGNEPPEAPPLPISSDISETVKLQDQICIITGASTSLRASHFVPKQEASWFKFHAQALEAYGGDPAQDLNSVRNEVALRGDLNGQGFDRGLFVMVPYANGIAAVFVKPLGKDLAYNWHLKLVHLPSRIRRGYLFVRFSWNIFKFLTPGLVDAAAAIQPTQGRPDGAGFLKEIHSKSHGGSTQGESKQGGSQGGMSKKQKTAGGAKDHDIYSETEDGHSLISEHDAARLAIFDQVDADLKTRPLMTDDLEAGRYPGFAAVKRLEFYYRRTHPQISAVSNPLVWEAGDDEDE
ncbi:hypothetical protein C8R46DRAFT_1350041 [Mycena filopes]|nr:hypothetical protein C8R46DRAFT_1350041 [Mycena filopes]